MPLVGGGGARTRPDSSHLTRPVLNPSRDARHPGTRHQFPSSSGSRVYKRSRHGRGCSGGSGGRRGTLREPLDGLNDPAPSRSPRSMTPPWGRTNPTPKIRPRGRSRTTRRRARKMRSSGGNISCRRAVPMIDIGGTSLPVGLAARKSPRPLLETMLRPPYSVRSTARMKSSEQYEPPEAPVSNKAVVRKPGRHVLLFHR